MLDLVEIVAPDQLGTDILPLAEFKRHLNLTSDRRDEDLTASIIDAAAKAHGPLGELNRTIFPTTWKLYLTKFPDRLDRRGNIESRVVPTIGRGVTGVGRGIIRLPLPPLISVLAVVIEDGESPETIVDEDLYVVRDGTIVPEIELKTGATWPTYAAGPRAISILYRAGYTTYPATLKRYVKFLAAHYDANKEATINEPRQMMLNRRVEFAMDDLRESLRVPVSYDDWE